MFQIKEFVDSFQYGTFSMKSSLKEIGLWPIAPTAKLAQLRSSNGARWEKVRKQWVFPLKAHNVLQNLCFGKIR